MKPRSRFTLRGLRCAILVCAAACDRGPPPLVSPPPVGPLAVGVPVFEANHWIEYVPGNAPLIHARSVKKTRLTEHATRSLQ